MSIRLIAAAGLAILSLFLLSPKQALAGDVNDRIYDVPHVSGIAIDGKSADWQGNGFVVSQFPFTTFDVPPAKHFIPHMRLGWDDRGLLVLSQVDQDTGQENDNPDALFMKDCVEIFVSTGRGNPDLWQAVVAPGFDPSHAKARSMTYDFRQNPELTKTPLSVEFASTHSNSGYVLEALLPWKCLGITPQIGREIGFQIYFHKYDGPGKSYQTMFYPVLGAPWAHDCMMRLRLADAPSPPITSAAFAGYDGTRAIEVAVAAGSDAVGKKAQVFDGANLLGSALLAPDGLRSTASIVLPMPKYGTTYGLLSVTLDSQQLAELSLTDATAIRRDAFKNARYDFDSYVFSGSKFPQSRMEHPGIVQDATGSYTIDRRFYASDLQQVTNPSTPGRYGAIVTIKNTYGDKVERRFTLYRTPAAPATTKAGPGRISSPFTALGINPAVAARQSAFVSRIGDPLSDSFARDERSARALAVLRETSPTAKPYGISDNPAFQNAAWWYRLDKSLGQGKLPAIVKTPRDYNVNSTRRWPLIVFLHGSGDIGVDLNTLQNVGTAPVLLKHADLGFIIAAPVVSRGPWVPAQVMDLVDDICAKYRVDPDRICLTGFSLGAIGTWMTAERYPHRFAALAPVSGWGDPSDVRQLANTSIWIFHGAKDEGIKAALAQQMYDAVVAAKGHVRYTLYTDIGHGPWRQVYSRPDFYVWAAQQRLGHSGMVSAQDSVAGQVGN